MLVKSTADATDMLDMSKERLEAIKQEADMVELETLMRYIRVLSELTNQIRYATGKRVLVEVALIKLTKPAMEKDFESIINRISDLERKVEEGVVVQGAQPIANMSAMSMPMSQPVSKPKVLQPAVTEEVQQAVNSWEKVITRLSPLVRNSITAGRLTVAGDDRLLIVFTEGVNYGTVA